MNTSIYKAFSLALVSLFMASNAVAWSSAKGEAEVYPERGNESKALVLEISGLAAQAIYESLDVAEVSGLGFETLTNTIKETEQVECGKAHTHKFSDSDDIKESISYACRIKVLKK